jgi:hypothetical protein
MSKSLEQSSKLLQSNVDERDVIMKIASVWYFVEFVYAGQFVSL